MGNPDQHIYVLQASGIYRSTIAYSPDILNELSEAIGLGPSSHLEAGMPHPHEELAEPQHTSVSHANGSNRFVLHHNVK